MPARSKATDVNGHAGSAIRLAVVGDSLARGFRFGWPRGGQPGAIRVDWTPLLRWFDDPDRGYAALVADGLAADGLPVVLDRSLTCSGAPTAAFWADGAPVPAVRRLLTSGVDVVAVSLGANDLLPLWTRYAAIAMLTRAAPGPTRRMLLSALAAAAPDADVASRRIADLEIRLGGLVEWLQAHTEARRIVLTTYYCPDDSELVRERFIAPVNAGIRRIGDRSPVVRIADLEPLFTGRGSGSPAARRWVSAFDGLHPTASGHRAIAAAVLDAIRAE